MKLQYFAVQALTSASLRSVLGFKHGMNRITNVFADNHTHANWKSIIKHWIMGAPWKYSRDPCICICICVVLYVYTYIYIYIYIHIWMGAGLPSELSKSHQPLGMRLFRDALSAFNPVGKVLPFRRHPSQASKRCGRGSAGPLLGTSLAIVLGSFFASLF